MMWEFHGAGIHQEETQSIRLEVGWDEEILALMEERGSPSTQVLVFLETVTMD